MKKVNLQNWCQTDFLHNRTRVMAGQFSFFTILRSNLTKKYHQYWKKWTSKTAVKPTFYLITRVMAEFRTILRGNLTKKYHQYWKKVNLQNWCQTDFLPNKTRVMANFRFLRFCVVIWLKNITNIEKSEPPKLVSNRLFT